MDVTPLCENIIMALSLEEFILSTAAEANVIFEKHQIPLSMTWDASLQSYKYSIGPRPPFIQEQPCYYVYYTPRTKALNGLTILLNQSKENCDLPQTRTGSFLLRLTDAIAAVLGASRCSIQDKSTVVVKDCKNTKFALYRIATKPLAQSWYEEHGYRPNDADFEKTLSTRKHYRSLYVKELIRLLHKRDMEMVPVIPGLGRLPADRQKRMLGIKKKKNTEAANQKQKKYTEALQQCLDMSLTDAVKTNNEDYYKLNLLLYLFNEFIHYDMALEKHYGTLTRAVIVVYNEL